VYGGSRDWTTKKRVSRGVYLERSKLGCCLQSFFVCLCDMSSIAAEPSVKQFQRFDSAELFWQLLDDLEQPSSGLADVQTSAEW